MQKYFQDNLLFLEMKFDESATLHRQLGRSRKPIVWLVLILTMSLDKRPKWKQINDIPYIVWCAYDSQLERARVKILYAIKKSIIIASRGIHSTHMMKRKKGAHITGNKTMAYKDKHDRAQIVQQLQYNTRKCFRSSAPDYMAT